MDNYAENQRKLHACHVILLEEVKRICSKHGLKYFAIAGTLLGAVRHKGAIPWDDDMDLGLLRPDYERFLQYAKQELSEHVLLQNFDTESGYGLPFAKLMLRDTVMVERSAAGNTASKGIYIDIFPLDNAPENPEEQKKHDRSTYFLKRLLLAKQGYKVYRDNEIKKKIVYGMLFCVASFLSREKIYNALDKAIQQYNQNETCKIVNIGGAYGYQKEMLEKKWFTDTLELPFENTTISAPSGYKEYLTYFYGDYMTPPPENKRGDRHSIVELDFGPYDEVLK